MKLNGWYRLWIGLSAVLFLLVSFFAVLMRTELHSVEVIFLFSFYWFLPAVSVFFLGHMVAWIIRGFSKNEMSD